MNADSVVLGVDGTAAEGKPTWLSENADGSGDYAKEKCIATNSGWVFMPGSTATGSDNTNSQPEVIECHRRLKDTIDVPTGRQVTIGTGTSKTTFFPDGDTFTGSASSDLGDVVAYVYYQRTYQCYRNTTVTTQSINCIRFKFWNYHGFQFVFLRSNKWYHGVCTSCWRRYKNIKCNQ